MPCPVHRHPYGGDRLRRPRARYSFGGTVTLSGGTATPRVVPTWTRLSSAENRVSPDTTVFTAAAGAVHRRRQGGATAIFLETGVSRAAGRVVTATLSDAPTACF
jgi:hypothetical protein